MKLVIAGSRHLDVDQELIEGALWAHKVSLVVPDDEIVAGGCPTGADRAAHDFAYSQGFKYKEFPADWKKYGNGAGPRRNAEMAVYGDALLLIWDGKSAGSANMRARMAGMKKPIYEVIFRSENV
ncbi:MAG: SLOG family protein [Candidatus Methanoperedens sp.]|nr:SLOG family protein [Candidatus Methanoperedens sp.]